MFSLICADQIKLYPRLEAPLRINEEVLIDFEVLFPTSFLALTFPFELGIKMMLIW